MCIRDRSRGARAHGEHQGDDPRELRLSLIHIFKKGDTKTAKAVTEALKALYEDGTVETIAAKYADQGLSMDNWQLK